MSSTTEELKVQQVEMRLQGKALIEVVFEGIDHWYRAVFKSIQTEERFGSLDKLVDTEDKARTQITEQDLVYLGNSFECDPWGTPPQGIIKIVWEKPHD
jgi:hypothetical protein